MGEVRRPTYTVRDPKTGATVTRTSRVWWIRYYRNGQRIEESAESTKKGTAIALLHDREGDVAKGLPVGRRMNLITFDEAATDLLNDYTTNRKRSVAMVRRRLAKHLLPFFGGRRLATIGAADVRAYVAARQAQGVEDREGQRIRDVSNAEINRELALLKRAFRLAHQAEKIGRRPHIPLLRESAPRAGFFEPEQVAAVLAHLPAPLRPPILFAYLTGWRIPSEVLPLQWRHVDVDAGEVRLDPGTTKSGAGRVIVMTADLRALLEAQRAAADAYAAAGTIVPWVFWRDVAKGRGGPKAPTRITTFGPAWKAACRAAGCPGRIPHDLRRSAIRRMVRAGIPERVAMRMSGHKTASVFAWYDIISDTDLHEAAGKLDAYAAGRIEAPAGAKPPGTGQEKGKIGGRLRPAGRQAAETLRKTGGAVRI